MNAMGMLFNQPPVSATNGHFDLSKRVNNPGKSNFSNLLNQTNLDNNVVNVDELSRIRSLVKEMSQLSELDLLPLGTMEDYESLLSFTNGLSDLANLTETELKHLLTELESTSDDMKAILESLGLNINLTELTEDDYAKLTEIVQLQPVLEQVIPLMKELNNGGISSKDWLKLLDQLSPLPQDLKHALSSKLLDEDNQTLMKDMLQKYQSRMALNDKGYVTHGKVTTSDLSKWLTQALERQSAKPQTSFGEAFSLSKGSQPLEQLTVHLSQSAATDQQTLNQELLHQFEAVLGKMQIGKNPFNQQQLKLQLNPNNLGQITIEMTEIDGEMFVKIIATSEMAKEALESNMKELRHMFSPHQVIVEQEETTQVAGTSEWLDYEESDEKSHNHEEPSFYQEEDEDVDMSFSDILSQEGV